MFFSQYVFEYLAEKKKFERFEEGKEPEAKHKDRSLQFWKNWEQRSRHRQAPGKFEQRWRGRTPETSSKILIFSGIQRARVQTYCRCRRHFESREEEAEISQYPAVLKGRAGADHAFILDLFHFQIYRILHNGSGETRSSSASRKALSDEPSFQGAYHVGVGEANSRRSRNHIQIPGWGFIRLVAFLSYTSFLVALYCPKPRSQPWS